MQDELQYWLNEPDDWPLDDEEKEPPKIIYDSGRFNIILSEENEPEDYYDYCRGPLYDVFYLNNRGEHRYIGQMQRECDTEGEFIDFRYLDIKYSNALECIAKAFKRLFGKEVSRWYSVVSMD